MTKVVLAKVFNNKKLKTEQIYLVANIDNVEYLLAVLSEKCNQASIDL